MTIVLGCDDRHTGCPGPHGMTELFGVKGHNCFLHGNHHNGEGGQSQDYDLKADKVLTHWTQPGKGFKPFQQSSQSFFQVRQHAFKQPSQACCNGNLPKKLNFAPVSPLQGRVLKGNIMRKRHGFDSSSSRAASAPTACSASHDRHCHSDGNAVHCPALARTCCGEFL